MSGESEDVVGGKKGNERRWWGVQSLQKFGPLDEDLEVVMRRAYIECLLGLVKHVVDGGPLLRVIEISVYKKPEDDEASCRLQAFENDEEYDRLVRRRTERAEKEKRKEEEGNGEEVDEIGEI